MTDTMEKELTLDIKQKVLQKTQEILNANFTGYKAEIVQKHGRLNFCCPYCGDSSDGKKKRGNLYWNSLMFHCYNGGCSKKHSNIVGMLKDFGKKFDNVNQLSTVLDYIKNNHTDLDDSSFLEFGVFEYLINLSIDREKLKSILGLVEIENDKKSYSYLKARLLHKRLDKFLYSPKEDAIYVLNTYKDSIVGYQVKPFDKTKQKYISYTIEKIYKDVLKDDSALDGIEDLERINTLSIYFDIFHVDFTKPFYIFEGPLDCFLYPGNSIAVSGSDKNTDMFDDNPNVNYFFDNDKAGKNIMTTKIKKGNKVFLWQKLFLDYRIEDNIKDFNDLMIYCFRTKNQCYKNLDKYFSKNKLDIYFL